VKQRRVILKTLQKRVKYEKELELRGWLGSSGDKFA
jgi:hypothetical protein